MASEHDLALVDRIRAGTASGVLAADDPEQVAHAVSGAGGVVVAVDVGDLDAAVAAARVRLAELVVARARRAELGGGAASRPGASGPAGAAGAPAGARDADRQAVRFAFVILVLALAGGVAVFLADGLVLAPALPAVALVALGGVVLAHRRPAAAEPEPVGVAADVPAHAAVDVDAAPAVRAAEAHLRRQRAAWKLVWWERSAPVPDLDDWTRQLGPTVPITLVSVDGAGRFDAGAHAATTTAAPASVRVVVLQAR
jgi:hypothetical protein